ncbi:bola-like protein [Cryphonectria parasitica EP155]|uniref:Bola-like protein n=1 Tax=Cryphonectria parasitica (strain ATCC 38755 / EP155) TaxID=660469 RepID=A0A9P4XZH9_CRYP1|nr:bola-like protein [Cryphonectria parasitica EP155]KAF3763766.1 bola-like protein [Cryphonectria parasitica EP155]
MGAQAISEESLKAAIAARLNAVYVEITDMSGGCGQAFSVLIVSPEFAAKNSLKRHRLVNSALKEEIAAIHAWTAKCQTPQEWEKATAAVEPPLDGTVDGKVEGTAA